MGDRPPDAPPLALIIVLVLLFFVGWPLVRILYFLMSTHRAIRRALGLDGEGDGR